MPTLPPPHAIVLAAGLGTRLRAASGVLPKPLLEVGGMSLLVRSLRTLRSVGITEVTLAVGYRGTLVSAEARRVLPGVIVAENADPEGTGSMRSLALAWAARSGRPDRVLIVEGDLLYDRRAPDALLGAERADTVLVTDPTGAGDEVWVCGEGERIREISKAPRLGLPVIGELVGLSLLSAETLDAMVETHRAGGAALALEHYEERISALSAVRDIRAVRGDLPWAEIDDPSHLRRAVEHVLPRLEPPAP